MALQSPRFFSSKRLVNASNGIPLRQGAASGRAIHLVQMALIDLGYLMPRSTGNPNYSPDGVFGNEMKATLIAFQKANPPLAQTGEIDRATMLALDSKFRGYKHRVRLHFRSISLMNVPFSRSLADAEIVYGQYGIKAEFSSGMSLMLSAAEEAEFSEINSSCEWVITDGQYLQLHGMGPSVPTTEVLVYYVQELVGPSGCGGHAVNRPACTVDNDAFRWDTAHEVGHVLLTSTFSPVHITDRRNLMFPTSNTTDMVPVLTDRQVAQIRNSPCCVSI